MNAKATKASPAEASAKASDGAAGPTNRAQPNPVWMQMSWSSGASFNLERDASAAAEESEADRIAHHALHGSVPTHPALQLDVPSREPTGGRELAPAVRADMEPRFGIDLRNVRVHTGASGARETTRHDTAALTFGDDIYFAPGQYRPNRESGRRVLAHELAHVTQQRTSGSARHAAWPGPPEQTQLQRANRAIYEEALRAIRSMLLNDEEGILSGYIATYVEQHHDDEPTEDELEAMRQEIDRLEEIEAYVVGAEQDIVLDVLAAVQMLHDILGQPREVADSMPTEQVSFGTEFFIRWVAQGIADMVTRPLGRPVRDFPGEFDAFVSLWGDAQTLMEFELEATIDELIWLRSRFNEATAETERAHYGEQVGVAARRARLLDRAISDVATTTDTADEELHPLDRAIMEASPRIEEVRRQGQTETDTLTALGGAPSTLRPQQLELSDSYLTEEPAHARISPDEAFPMSTRGAVEHFSDVLADHVRAQRSDLEDAARDVVPPAPSDDFDEFLRVYRHWFQFYSRLGRNQDPMYRDVDQLVSGFNQIALMFDEGALLHPLLMNQFAPLVSGVIGGAQADFGDAVPRLQRRQRLTGDAESVRYQTADLFEGTPGSLSTSGERVSRTSLLERERQRTRELTDGEADGWTYLIETEHWDGTSTQEAVILDPDVARYLVTRMQHLATLESGHYPGVGDDATVAAGIEEGRGTAEQRYLEGQPDTTTNRSVESDLGTVRSAARAAGAAARDPDNPRSGTSRTAVTGEYINELETYLNAFFADQADIAHRIAATLVISDAEYGSFAHIRQALTPSAIAQGLGIALGVKILQKAITKLASRAVARSVLGGLDRMLTIWGGSDISRMVQVAVWMEHASGVSSLHEARVWAYFGRFTADAIGNLLQSAVVGAVMTSGQAGLGAFRHYRATSAPRTARELTNTLAPVLSDPAAREVMLESVRQEIAELQAATPEGQSNPDLVALQAIENDLVGRSGEHDAADVTLAHDTRTPEQRMQEALDQAGIQGEMRTRLEEAAAHTPEDGPAVAEGAASRAIADPDLTLALGVEGMPVQRSTTWEGRGVRIHYTTRELLGVTLVDQVHVEVGKDATHADVALHGATARRLQQLQGVTGLCRRLWGRIEGLWDGMPHEVKEPGTLGFEAYHEIQKLPEIIQRRQAELDAYNSANPRSGFPDARSRALEAQLRGLEGQLQYYEGVIRDMEAIASGGRGWIAALPSGARTVTAEGIRGRPGGRVLLLGEGDFSFTAALVRELGSGSDVVATSYDSRATVESKYPGRESEGVRAASEHISEASEGTSGATVEHGVDATRIRGTLASEGRFDSIVFNFPYVPEASRGGTANTRAMLDGFFANASEVLAPGGRVYLTLAGDFHANRYRPAERAGPGWRLVEVQRFDPAAFEGYRHQRTVGHGSASSTVDAHGMTFVFEKVP